MQTLIAPATAALPAAAALLRAGDLIAFPTETVYGLGADARSPAAVQKIYTAKGRPAGNPLIVHVADSKSARECVTHWPTLAEKLADQFWPGPLTLILPRSSSITPLVSAGRSTVALRIPNHPIAQQLLHQFAGPIAAPSANRSGFTSPTTAAHVYAELAGRIPLILDAGPSSIGLESTVLDLTQSPPAILRPGAITQEMLLPLIPRIRQLQSTLNPEDSAASPGQHLRHYAPHAPAYRFQKSDWPLIQHHAKTSAPLALLTSDNIITLPAPHETTLLPTNESDYARTLYSALREADERNPKAIFVLLPEITTGLWSAIRDRLNRATELLPSLTTNQNP